MGIGAVSTVILTFLANSFLLLVVFRNNPKSWTNRLVASLALIFALWTVGNLLALWPGEELVRLFWVRVVMLITAPMGGVTFLLAQIFPDSELPSGKKYLTWFVCFIMVATGIFALSPWMFVSLNNTANGGFDLTPGPAMILFAINHMGFTTIGCVLLVRKLLQSRGKVRFQRMFFITGTILTLILITLSNFVAVVFFGSMQYTFIGPTFTLFQVGLTTYAIVRHRLFDVRQYVIRAVVYTLFIFLLGLVFAFSFFYLRSVVFPSAVVDLRDSIIFVPLALGLALIFHPLRIRVDKLTDHIFFQHRYDPSQVLYDMALIMASTLRLDDLAHYFLRELLSEIGIERGFILILDGDTISSSFHEGFTDTPPYPTKEDLALCVSGRGIVLYEELPEGRLKERFFELRVYAAIPIRTRKEHVGVLFLGEKKSGDPYSGEDIRVLDIVAPEAALAIQNALAYEKISLFNETLKSEISKATEELKHANEHLLELDKLKDEFVSIASHELRTPLTAIKGFLSLELDKKLPKESKDHLVRAYSGVERMIGLTNDMLDVSRIESGRIELVKDVFNITALTREVLEDMMAKATLKKIRLSINTKAPYILTSDKNKIQQVLINLIDNAIKFTPEKGTVSLSLKKKNNFIEVSVTDTGIGIVKDQFEKAFSKFGRLDTSATKIGQTAGTGLGLYVCRKLVELSGGKLSLESKIGVGSVFRFTLPV
ncbi:GAF domain-containing protein [Candidatus Gottesmanbacteria bacterium]|nr:GAF domain-containing protein [Candidatus Gottesmanbacteria bacterium]